MLENSIKGREFKNQNDVSFDPSIVTKETSLWLPLALAKFMSERIVNVFFGMDKEQLS